MIPIKYYRKLKNVDRLSRTAKHRSYNLMEHSYMVTVLFRQFASKEDIAYDMIVLDYVMHHDILETITGDLPYDIKNQNRLNADCWDAIELNSAESVPGFTQYTDKEIQDGLSPQQYKLFKVCDLLDLWIFLKEEQGLGNIAREILTITNKCEQLIIGQFRTVDKYMQNYEFNG